MKANAALQIIFAFFLGLVVVAFVGIAVNTFYPRPEYPNPTTPAAETAYQDASDQWYLITSIILLICATAILAISLFLPEKQGVLSNGLLLGGIFTMLYAVGVSFSAETSYVRLAVMAVALAVTIGIGYLKFVRRRGPAVAAAATSELASGQVGELDARLSAVEHKLDALGRALDG
ncbi:hypothetical protein [Propionimicrobium sp. PCR01-08-3]|uniref:hypothetical protein n=1 Tax=Propionimicrobium sp. PCR01-08-3 TaxID=3052086 RepID=UPI00255CD1D6|nr:hypothetical protein [Propionimicrobium sp. PCR01-08-3]WIY82500.1 hypothetical protein QQ658_13510 [Propionimicrobium sp. PCR01-08-3]